MQIKKLIALAALAVGAFSTTFGQSAAEQLKHKPAPYLFFGIQGGAQTTFTNYDQMKLITPTASISFGGFFTPILGVRLNANGMWDKGGIKPNFTYEYKYVTTDLDMLLNLCTFFGNKDYYPMNVYLIGGFGLTYAWDNDDLTKSAYMPTTAWEDHRLSHNMRFGLQFDLNLCKHLSMNLEVDANVLSDRFNSKTSDKEDWMVTAQLGLAYKFGYPDKAAPLPAAAYEEAVPVAPAAPAAATKPQEVTKEVVKPQPVVQKAEMQTEIFFAIRQTTVNESEQHKVASLVKFLKDNPKANVTVTGYADAGTGNPRINMMYSTHRAENVAKALLEAGIDAARITVNAKGDTVQPYNENDKNRVVIAISK